MKQKSALVLSGGGALGLAHVGALRLLGQKYEFDYLAGVSAGAIVAAGLACEMSAEEIEIAIDKTNIFALAFDLSKKNTGFITGRNIYATLCDIYGDRTFADLKYPLRIGATNFATGKRVTISEGLIADAVRGSLSVPVLFEPYYHKGLGQYLVDGGLTQNFPLDLALDEYEGDCILGINVTNIQPLPGDFDTAKFWGRNADLFKNLQRTFQILFQSQQASLKLDERVKIIEPDLSDYSSITLSRRTFQRIMDVGEEWVQNHFDR